MAARPTLFFDLGGVILTNAWDHAQRREVAARFGLDAAEFEAKHASAGPALETGALSTDAYLDATVFDRPRGFSRGAFWEAMRGCSGPLPESLSLLGELAAAGKARLATLNNEGRELNRYRIERFELARYFQAFCSSCYLGERKPGAEIYRRALGIMQAAPCDCLFVDDREENLAAPRELGMASVHFAGAAQLRQELRARGLL
ncbi:MAG TPA: HAD-IA family hydrolase [Terriglobales bacterium]|nr:HAD-IA family hydrolase [Terriglobales bacterium]